MSPEQQIHHWLKAAVIELNLCPFAKAPYDAGAVKIVTQSSVDEESLLSRIQTELQILADTSDAELETTVVAELNLLADFDDYLDVLDIAQQIIGIMGLEGTIQVASFHPEYQFEGTTKNCRTNFTNRSPYPMFHLIREASIESVLAHFKYPEKIPKRNQQVMQAMTQADLKRIFPGLVDGLD